MALGINLASDISNGIDSSKTGQIKHEEIFEILEMIVGVHVRYFKFMFSKKATKNYKIFTVDLMFKVHVF